MGKTPDESGKRKPEGISRRGLLVGLLAGGTVGASAGAVSGAVAGFGYGLNKAVEVAPDVAVDTISRETKERLDALDKFWDSVEPLVRKIILQLGNLVMAMQKRTDSLADLKVAGLFMGRIFKEEAVDWLVTGDRTLDKTVQMLSEALNSDPELGPLWRSVLASFDELKGKQAEYETFKNSLSIKPEDLLEIEETMRSKMLESISKDLPF